MEKNTRQSLFLLQDAMMKSEEKNKMNIIYLKHPKTDSKMICILDSTKRIYEFVHFKEDFSSWFVDESVIEDGSLHLLTPLDPLFLLLPCFNQKGKFCPLDNIIVDEEFPDMHYLLETCNPDELSNITDSKDCAGLQVYCYNKSKTLNWLKKKVQQVANVLKERNVDVSDGSRSSLLNVSKKDENEEIFCRFACHIVSEYIKEELSEELFDSFGFQLAKQDEKCMKNEVNEEPKTKAKRQKSNEAVSPVDDYSKVNNDSAQNKQKSKLSIAQKKLLKVDKSGMKNISSFFQKK